MFLAFEGSVESDETLLTNVTFRLIIFQLSAVIR